MPGQVATAGGSAADSRRPKRKRRSQSPSNPEVIARRERDAECVRLRRNGLTFDAIARTLGYSDSGHAYNAFTAFMRAYPKEDVDTARQLECDRLDAMQAAIWARVLDDQDSNQHWAMDRALKISDQRARLLGLNKPVRQEVTVLTESTVDTAIAALKEQLAAQALAAGVELPALPAVAEVLSVEAQTVNQSTQF